MITKTEAICIKNTRYGESSVICKMFTAEHGLGSFMVQGLNRKSSAIRPSHIAPGNIVDMVIYQKPQASIQRIKELRIKTPMLHIHTDMVKNAVLQFMLEIIVKTNEEHLKDEMIFNFIKKAIHQLEIQNQNLGSTPLFFLCSYLKFSGWFPNLEYWEKDNTFNLIEGKFESPNIAQLANILGAEHSNALYNFLLLVQEEENPEIVNPLHRRELFNTLLSYYEIHLLKGRKINSPAILAEVLG